MKRLFFIFFIFFFSAALASAEETYGNGTYGNFSYGISSSASSSFTNSSVNIQNNTRTLINATATNVMLEIVTNAAANGSVTIVKYNSKPTAVGTNTFTALNRYIDIVVDDSISDQLNYSIIKMFYTDAEVAAANLDESTLRLQKWNGTNWIQFNGPNLGGVATADNYVWANTSSFSTWGVFGTSPQAPQPANEDGGGRRTTAVTPITPSPEPVIIPEKTPESAVPSTPARSTTTGDSAGTTSTEQPQQEPTPDTTSPLSGQAVANVGRSPVSIAITIAAMALLGGVGVWHYRKRLKLKRAKE